MDRDQRELLLSLAYLYICSDREWRALPLLLLVTAENPDDCVCLRLLAHVYTTVDRAELALVVLDRVSHLAGQDIHGDSLLRARALHRLGRIDEARLSFENYTQALPESDAA
ncbi:tetratricopeptide repeat protein [Tanticharoenia sakaeratensis]|jgi:hypothetical protein|uniref:Uncharacterized protein n=1 Tax=Tanticharoenia sakaeratensis NBRC 103193 TaxID=1231623 RepID=A0A0D6MMT1_9PROT|nr:hypothetical protein [Tanticharoenia sakaeratensis]GAN54979.1 hypothetical protein Tasa_035_014 [Tanticharoenia sakaeratensis NBRC 103193]GBQ16632.1 hypothetical protein AA103193_0052 [Tanticharoenia sakaeratensis NBRC 103193]